MFRRREWREIRLDIINVHSTSVALISYIGNLELVRNMADSYWAVPFVF